MPRERRSFSTRVRRHCTTSHDDPWLASCEPSLGTSPIDVVATLTEYEETLRYSRVEPASRVPIAPADRIVAEFALQFGLSREDAAVLFLMISGFEVKEIAERLGRSLETVRRRTKRIRKTLGCNTTKRVWRRFLDFLPTSRSLATDDKGPRVRPE